MIYDYRDFHRLLVCVYLAILLVSGSMYATCVFIDKQVTQAGRSVFFLGDWHRGTHGYTRKQQDAIIAAAKQRKAICIVEDMLGYDGDDYVLRDAIDVSYYNHLMSWSDIPVGCASPLVGLASRCASEGIPCVNSEARYELSRFYKSHKEHEKVDIYFPDALWAEMGQRSQITPIPLERAADLMSRLIDNRVRRELDRLLADADDKRDIFIFTGMRHLREIPAYLARKWGCRDDSNYLFARKRLGRAFYDQKNQLRTEIDDDAWQRGVQRFIDTYAVNIEEYFAAEQESEREKKKSRGKGCLVQ